MLSPRRPRAVLVGLGGLALLATALGSAAIAAPGVRAVAAPGSHTVADGLLGFGTATVVDPVLFGGEPGLNFDPSTSGSRSYVDWPDGSTQVGVLYRSEDGGLSYTKRYADPADATSAGAACAGRQVPICPAGGGGDTDVQIDPKTGQLLFSSQVALANEAAGISDDHGDTFPATQVDTAVGKGITAVDRQWLGQFVGTRTSFLGFHVPLAGYYLYRNDNGGAVGQWGDPASPVPGTPLAKAQILGVTQSGSMVIDNGPGVHGTQALAKGQQRAIYVGFLSAGDLVPSACEPEGGFAVGVSLDGGKTFTCHAVPDGGSARNFTVVQLDSAGNLYAAWTDSETQHTYLSVAPASYKRNATAPGSDWLPRTQVDGDGDTVTIFPNVFAGSPGRVAVGFYATKAKAATPDDVKVGSSGWSPNVVFTDNALCQLDGCTGPTFHQSVVSERANQNDNICTSGTACAATMGNRNLADYFDISLDRQGHLGFVWSDGNNATKFPYVKVARQVSGPSLFAGQPAASGAKRKNGVADAKGDARYPFSGAQVRTSPNVPHLDLTGTTVALKDARTLEVRMGLADAAKVADLVPAQAEGTTVIRQARYVTRWDFGGDAYYAEATVPRGGAPTFGAGVVNAATSIQTNAIKGTAYPPLTAATGKVEGNTLVVDVPVADVGSPKLGSTLVSVGSYALIGNTDLPLATTVPNETFLALPLTVDSSPTFTTSLARSVVTRPQAPPGTTPGGTTPGGTTPGGTTPGTGGTGLAATGLSAGVGVVGLVLLLLAGVLLRRRRVHG